MNNNKVLIAVLAFLLIILIVLCGVFVLTKGKPENTTTTVEDSNDTPSSIDVMLPLTDDAGDEYINKLYFVGDSTTYHFFKGGIDRSHIFVPESLTLMLSSDINNIIVGNKGLTIPKAIKDADCEIVIITLGVNGADSFTEMQYKTYYKKLINAIKSESPDTTIIIQSVFPVTKWYSDQGKGITNAGIDRLNVWAKELASEENVRYLDTQSILKDENGAQFDYYNEDDGVHMNEDAYRVIIQYIRTHAVQ